jgi:alpha-amylase
MQRNIVLVSVALVSAVFAWAGDHTESKSVDPIKMEVNRGIDRNWWHKTTFYEIWPRSFIDADGDGSGDFQGLIEGLPYLKELGVGGIWLTPVFESPSYHGYDFQDFYAVESDYGTMEDFKAFIDASHEHGIKVVLDLVLNHISDQHPWFIKSANKEPGYEDFFVWRDEMPTEWGAAWEDTANPERVWNWHEGRGQYYYAAFSGSQPDINMANPGSSSRDQKAHQVLDRYGHRWIPSRCCSLRD